MVDRDINQEHIEIFQPSLINIHIVICFAPADILLNFSIRRFCNICASISKQLFTQNKPNFATVM